MNIVWKYAGTNKKNFKGILNSFKESEFKSHTRSTVPFLQYWRNPTERLIHLSGNLGIALPKEFVLDVEHEVDVVFGEGRSSCTDMKIISPECSIAIEAKFKESRYRTCSKWLLDTNAPENKRLVLKGWLKLINDYNTTDLSIEDVLELPYQVIHRTASACHGSSPNKFLVYQVFNPSKRKENMYNKDLFRLKELLGGNPKLKIYFHKCELKGLQLFNELEKRWNTKERDLSEDVVEGLINNSLMITESIDIYSISSTGSL